MRIKVTNLNGIVEFLDDEPKEPIKEPVKEAPRQTKSVVLDPKPKTSNVGA